MYRIPEIADAALDGGRSLPSTPEFLAKQAYDAARRESREETQTWEQIPPYQRAFFIAMADNVARWTLILDATRFAAMNKFDVPLESVARGIEGTPPPVVSEE